MKRARFSEEQIIGMLKATNLFRSEALSGAQMQSSCLARTRSTRWWLAAAATTSAFAPCNLVLRPSPTPRFSEPRRPTAVRTKLIPSRPRFRPASLAQSSGLLCADDRPTAFQLLAAPPYRATDTWPHGWKRTFLPVGGLLWPSPLLRRELLRFRLLIIADDLLTGGRRKSSWQIGMTK